MSRLSRQSDSKRGLNRSELSRLTQLPGQFIRPEKKALARWKLVHDPVASVGTPAVASEVSSRL
jgi:hypothetical protein